MLNKLLLSLTLLFLSINLRAQSDFREGDNVVSFGVGLGSALGSFSSNSRTPGLSVQFEHGQWEVGGPGTVSIGGYLGYKGFKNSGTFPTMAVAGAMTSTGAISSSACAALITTTALK